jgi:hypothetical protein
MLSDLLQAAILESLARWYCRTPFVGDLSARADIYHDVLRHVPHDWWHERWRLMVEQWP